MSYEMEYLTGLYCCGARGTVPQPPTASLSWEKVIALASQQSIPYTVAMAMKKAELGCPAALRSRLLSSALGAALQNQMKTAQLLHLIGQMEANGVSVLLLKGIDAARQYAEPECRVSADTDLLVRPRDEKKTLRFLQEAGFTVKKRTHELHHSTCTHPQLGMVEVHIRLWEDVWEKEIFAGQGKKTLFCEPIRTVETPNGVYHTLGVTDTLLFLTLHMLKHFFMGGASLRMLMDIALFAAHHAEALDTARYTAALHAFGYETAVETLLGALVYYGKFPPNELPFPVRTQKETAFMILDDLERGGWQGKLEEEERREGWFYFRNTRRTKSSLRLQGEILRDRLAAFFPSRAHLARDYPVVLRFAALYPVCWLRRLMTRGLRAVGRGRLKSRRALHEMQAVSQAGQKRMELFQKLGL